MGRIEKIMCNACKGRGQIDGRRCAGCDGKGQRIYEEVDRSTADRVREEQQRRAARQR